MQRPILSGRERELNRLKELGEIALAGRGSLVFISGEAGIGKTRLAEEFKNIALGAGFQFLTGRCIPGKPFPFLPFREAFSGQEGLNSEATSNIGLRGFLSLKKPKEDAWTGDRILFNTLEVLKKVAEKRHTVILIEDVQWADALSIQMLHFFARNSKGIRAMIIVTYRLEEVLPTYYGEKHPLLEHLRIMRREQICEELALSPLSVDELRTALEGMVGGTLEEWLIEKIAVESGGNPLFAEETMKMLIQSGELVNANSKWIVKDKRTLVIPSAAREVIVRRLESTPTSHLRLLEVASVYGTHFNLPVVQSVLKIEALNMYEIVEELVGQYQLISPYDGNYCFKHELVKSVTYDQISMPRRKELHRMIAAQMEEKGVNETEYGLLSTHFQICGDIDKALEYSLLAADQFFKQDALLDAREQYRAALSMVGDNPRLKTKKLYLLEKLGDTNHALLQEATAAEYYEALLEDLSLDCEKARVYIKLAQCYGPYGLGKGNFEKALELLHRAESYSNLDDLSRANIATYRANLLFYEGNFHKSIVHSSQAEELYRKCGESELLITELCTHATSYMSVGEISGSTLCLQRGKEIHSNMPVTQINEDLEYTWAMVLFHKGNYDQALSILRGFEGRARAKGLWDRIVAEAQMTAFMFDAQDRLDEAEGEARRCCEAAAKSESEYCKLRACITIAHVLGRRGKQEEAKMKCHDLLEIQDAYKWEVPGLQRGLGVVALAEQAALRGEFKESNAGFESGLDILQMSVYGMLFSAMANKWFGDGLIMQDNRLDSLWHYEGALRIYKRMGNMYQIRKLEDLIQSF